MATDKTIRAFIAIPLPDPVREGLDRLQGQLRSGGVRVRWVKAANCHLTLAFLGEIASQQAASIAAALCENIDGLKPFDLCVQGLGVFPNLRRPRVLWCGVGGQTNRLQQVYRRVMLSLGAGQIEKDPKPFKAHITIGRFKQYPEPRLLADAICRWGRYKETFLTDRIVLYQSRLTPTGPIYSVFGEAALISSGQLSSNP